MTGERVLVVDDSKDIRSYIIDVILKPYAFQYQEASDGAQGLAMILEDPPDLALVDMQMPELSGMELVRKINEHDIHVPVILMTSHGSEELAVEMFRLGVRDYLIKPFDESDLFDAMDKALIETRLRRERDELVERLTDSNENMTRDLMVWRHVPDALMDLDDVVDRHAIMQIGSELLVALSNAMSLSIVLMRDGQARLMARRQGGTFSIDDTPQNDPLVTESMTEWEPRVGETSVNPADGETFIVHIVVPMRSGDIRGAVVAIVPAERVTEDLIGVMQVVSGYMAVGLDRARIMTSQR